MYLLILTTALSFASVSTSYITKPVFLWVKGPSKKERELISIMSEMRKQQEEISMMDNFAQHAKLQRKINSIEMELKNISNDKNANNYVFQLGVNYGIKFIFGLLLLGIVIYYRYTPIYIFPHYIDLYPFNNIVSYPNTEIGSVSVHFWLIVSNAVARQIVR